MNIPKGAPYTYDVEIYNGNQLVITLTVRSTNEEEAVYQAVKQLKTIVIRRYD